MYVGGRWCCIGNVESDCFWADRGGCDAAAKSTIFVFNHRRRPTSYFVRHVPICNCVNALVWRSKPARPANLAVPVQLTWCENQLISDVSIRSSDQLTILLTISDSSGAADRLGSVAVLLPVLVGGGSAVGVATNPRAGSDGSGAPRYAAGTATRYPRPSRYNSS